MRRCDTGDWELPSGHVDAGESASEAAVRETAEESGITVEVTGLVGTTPIPATSSPNRDSGCFPRDRGVIPAEGFESEKAKLLAA